MKLGILSVNVSRPKIIAMMNGEPVLSGIAKKPLGRERVCVSALNIEGDGQADLTVHGGFDKAVYAYCASHWPWWESEHRLACSPGIFGENLTLDAGDETQICIGDRFTWGDVEMEVAQPRAPCFKFAIHTQRPDAAQLMTASGRCGFYLRVTREGFAPALNVSLERSFASGAATVREAFFAVLGKASVESLEHVRNAPGLAKDWRSAVKKRIVARGI
ncbi:MAG TPA: MOSC domain-containing protein [Rhizomicrobium sp.]